MGITNRLQHLRQARKGGRKVRFHTTVFNQSLVSDFAFSFGSYKEIDASQIVKQNGQYRDCMLPININIIK